VTTLQIEAMCAVGTKLLQVPHSHTPFTQTIHTHHSHTHTHTHLRTHTHIQYGSNAVGTRARPGYCLMSMNDDDCSLLTLPCVHEQTSVPASGHSEKV